MEKYIISVMTGPRQIPIFKKAIARGYKQQDLTEMKTPQGDNIVVILK